MSHTHKAIIATGHPMVSAAAAEILQKGGNAFDAIIAAGFAGSIAEIALTSLGGGGFLLAKTRDDNGGSQEILFDFFVDTPGQGLNDNFLEPHFFPVTVHFPGSDQIFNIGLGSVAVPGNLKGFLHVHQRLGRIPLEKVLQPAIRLAEEGVEINDRQAYFLNLLHPIMTFFEPGRNLFSPNGRYVSRGDRIYNPEMIDFFKHLPEDQGKSFYHGEIAALIVNDMKKGQGLLTTEDLAAYQVIERQPLRLQYKDYTLLTNPPPSMGGSLVGLALSILETVSPKEFSWGSPEHIAMTAGLMAEVERLREQAITQNALHKAGENVRLFSRGTTHMSIADSEGNVASMTTSNGEGSGYFAPGTGIILNNMMGEDDLHPDGFHASPPGQRVASMMSPSLLVRDKNVELVLGSGGSKRIRTAIFQVINNVLNYRMDIQNAVLAPRMHWDGEIMQIEPGLSESAVKKIERKWPVNVWPDKDMYFGGVHAVVPGIAGAGDPRRGGSVVEIEIDNKTRK